MADRVHFVEPNAANDLRRILSNATRVENDYFGIRYRTQYGEEREILWLTKADAVFRCAQLRKRGYTVVAGPMD